MKFLAIWMLICAIYSAKAQANTIIIVTDEPGQIAARKFREEFLKTPPFDQIKNLKVEIAHGDSKKLNCSHDKDISRAFLCDDSYAVQIAQKLNANHVMVMVNSKKGGSATGVAVGGIDNKNINQTMIHELLHTLGFSDEYKYSKAESQFFCNEDIRSINVCTLPDKSPYSSDSYAREVHRKAIPWYLQILPATPITTLPKLGTPTSLTAWLKTSFGAKAVVGLYPAETCKEMVPPRSTWKPTNENSIMDKLKYDIPKFYWPAITEALGSQQSPGSSTETKVGKPEHGSN